jgi:hypothetical protein
MKEDVELYKVLGRWGISWISSIVGAGGKWVSPNTMQVGFRRVNPICGLVCGDLSARILLVLFY